MDTTRDIVLQFAKDTKHKEHELDSVKHIKLLCKKLLATQAPIVKDWDHVYHYVSDDLDRLDFRSERGCSPFAWAQYREIPLDAYKTLIGNNVDLKHMLKEGDTTYNDYIEHIQPIPKQSDGPMLFFMHGAKNKNLKELLEELYPNENRFYIKQLHDRIYEYKTHQEEDVRQVVRDVGFMIVNLNMPQIDELFLFEKPKAEKKTTTLPAKPVGNGMVELQPVKEELWSSTHERNLRNNPVMMQYRKQTGLASHFPSRKVLAQYLVRAIAPNHTVSDSLLGRKQSSVPDINVTTSHDDWEQALSVMNYGTTGASLTKEHPQAKYFYNILATAMPKSDLKQMDTRDFVSLWITAHSGKGWEKRWWNDEKNESASMKKAIGKYLKKYPQAPDELVELIEQGGL